MSQNLIPLDGVFILLLDTALKSFLLLLIAWVAAWLLRNRSAATVHRLWTLGFCGCLLIPAISLLVPTWNLPILPEASFRQPAENSQAVAAETGLIGSEQSLSQASGAAIAIPPAQTMSSTEPLAENVRAASDASADLPPQNVTTPAEAQTHSARLLAIALLLWWVSGVVVCLLRTAWHQVALLRVLGRCKPLDSKEWTLATEEAARSLGLNRPVRLLRLAEARSPMIARILRPAVVLPGDADNWAADQRRFVLLHELAHAKRQDVLTQTVAGFVCALHWFNPLAWYGLAQMRKLRELACDDLAIAYGQQPADYADVLLKVARSYQHRHPLMAVGMARGADVENRILAVLDRARSHVSLSRKAARSLLAGAAVLALLLGTVRLESQAEQNAASPTAEKETSVEVESENTEADDDFRTMEVRITDEAGKPLENARLYISVWYMKDYEGEEAPKEYFTNADGIVSLRLPMRLRILRMWPSKHGFVPEFVNFGKGTHDEGRLIPDRYEFQLTRGTELSGTVVNETGEPIEGVEVDVRVVVDEPAWTVNPDPMVSTWLTDEDFFEGPVVTDEDGKWEINTAPPKHGKKDYEFRLKFSHPNYASDSEWGELQQAQNLTTEMLRDGTAKLILRQGTRLNGTVVDSAGNPVTQGSVVWRDDPYGDAEEFETKLNEAGQFDTDLLLPGEHPIMVVAPGHQPERRMVTVPNEETDLQFKLKPGKILTVKVVDVDGTPIPGAYFHVGSWTSVEPAFDGGQSSVFDSRIPRRADNEGVFVWDGAPADAVTYKISATGFASNTVTLIAAEEEHVVELRRSLLASGKVTDAKTGELVRAFRVVPVLVRPRYLTSWFLGAVMGEEGQYEIRLDGISETNQHYKVRFEAEGYRSELSDQTFHLNDGHVAYDFVLEPAAAREGTVVDETGKPVASAAVVQATPSIVPSMENAQLEGGWSAQQIETSADGRFALAATSEPVRIRVAHKLGFAEVSRQPNEAIGTIQLQPWASVSGRLLHDGKPVPEETIFFSPIWSGQQGEPRFQDSFRTQADAEGHFEFERLPPIAGSIRASLGPWRDSALTSSQTTPLDLHPGENRSITLGGDAVTVTGRVVATGRDDAPLDKNWSLNYLISRERGIELPAGFPELSFDPTGPVKASWFLEPNHYDWLSTRENYFVKLQPDGQMRISGVPPGTYDLVLRLYEQPAGCLVETIGEKVVAVEITESDAAAGTKDIGDIQVECRAGPRVGESMQAYEFTDPTGRQQSIYEIKGRYVLLHVWASWCAPCLENMPDIQATVADLSDRPITFVGLNVDKDASRARELAERDGWNWSQNYLGDDSDVARQLAISSVPTYYLVGPDGLLVASSVEWSEIKDKLEDAMRETPQ